MEDLQPDTHQSTVLEKGTAEARQPSNCHSMVLEQGVVEGLQCNAPLSAVLGQSPATNKLQCNSTITVAKPCAFPEKNSALYWIILSIESNAFWLSLIIDR